MTYCTFTHNAGAATCTRCGRRVAVTGRNVIAKCRIGGPGTELSAILAGWPFYIQSTPTCPCKRHAEVMDAWGCDQCEARIEEIVGWLRQEAVGRGLPFSELVARSLVRRAISRARKKLATH